jgi:type I restriction enzyme S subunit
MKHGWATHKLGDLFEFKYGKGLIAEHRHVDGPIKVYGSNGIIGKHNHSLSKGPTVIVGRKGSVGEVHFSSTACWPIDTTYYVDKFPDGFPPRYWAFYLKSLQLGTHDKSSAIPGVSRKDMYGIEVPVPPPAEQCRIVAELEKLLARVEACQERLDKIPALLKRFRQSVLATACSGRLTADWREGHIEVKATKDSEISKNGLPEIPETWRWEKLPNAGEMSRGKSRHRPRNAPFLLGGSYPFIQTGDIAQSAGRITSHKQTYSEAGLAQSRLWPVNTVCITIAANIAESALLTYPACFPDSVVGIIADKSKCLPEFLEFFIRTAKSDLSTFAPATAQKNINIKILSDVLVPLPPLPEQAEIVRRVEALFKIADQIKERYKKAKAYMDKLTQSILAKAFRGELINENDIHCEQSTLSQRDL